MGLSKDQLSEPGPVLLSVEGVSASADEIRDQVEQMVISFGMLSQMAQDLNTAASQFQLGDHAAGEDE